MAVGTSDVLNESLQHSHAGLVERYETASAMASTPGQPRKRYEHIDTFLAAASKHLNAVDEVLLAAARRELPAGDQVVHDYQHAAKELEIVLAHVKGREYGSVYDAGWRWEDVWREVGEALSNHLRREADLADALAARTDPTGLDRLAERLHHAEDTASTRPHPYTPHTGLAGLVARRVLHAVDSFWDTAEGRMVPQRHRPSRGRPGKLTQYLLADPRFDEEEPGSS